MISAYCCTTCGNVIRADSQPACPHCMKTMRADENITIITDTQRLTSLEETLKHVKKSLGKPEKYTLNVNSYQYDIRSTLENDASPVAPEGTVTQRYVQELQDEMRELIERLESLGYTFQAREVRRESAQLPVNNIDQSLPK